MIKLENIYANSILPYDLYSIRNLVKKQNVKSLAELQKLIEEFPEYNWDWVKKEIDKAEKRMNLANKRGNEPEIYSTKGYSIEELNKQDEKNTGEILLLNSPLANSTKFLSIKNKSIKLIKEELGYAMPDGSNYFIKHKRHMGPFMVSKLLTAIEMYEEQIERQAKISSDINCDLFKLNKYEKQEIVFDKYKKIIEYLINNTKYDLSNTQKEAYMSSIHDMNNKDRQTKERVISRIANYTTLQELEELNKGNYKVLKRFI